MSVSFLSLPRSSGSGAPCALPAAASTAPEAVSARITSRLFFIVAFSVGSYSFVDRTLRTHQQGDSVLDLVDGEHLVGAEPRHQRTGIRRLRVVDLVIGRLSLGLAELANPAIPQQAR